MATTFGTHIARPAKTVLGGAVLCTVLGALGATENASGQGVAQATLMGIPPVLTSPLIADQARYLREGRYQMQFIYNASDSQPVDFVFRLTLERGGAVLLDLTSEPATFTRGVYLYTSLDSEPAIRFTETYEEIVATLSERLGQDVAETGVLSEGDYVLTIEPRAVDMSLPVLVVPGVAPFVVLFPEPPMPLTPWHESIVTEAVPVFSWLPVTGVSPAVIFEYELLLVELLPGQTPLQAIEGNLPIDRRVLFGQSTFSYTGDELPLDDGRRYVWQLTASDPDGQIPLSDDGRSEIQVFTYSRSETEVVDWELSLIDPAVQVVVADARRTPDGLAMDGLVRATADGAEVGANLAGLVLEPETIARRNGDLVLAGEFGGVQGVVQSGRAMSSLPDSTPPLEPSLSAAVSRTGAGRQLRLIIGPTFDAEAGIADVSYGLDESVTGRQIMPDTLTGLEWEVLATLPAGVNGLLPEFPGLVHTLRLESVTAEAFDLRIRIRNGLGMETVVRSAVSPQSDVSPPLVQAPAASYRGYYDRLAPNRIRVGETEAIDFESGVQSILYRVLDALDYTTVVDWTPLGGVDPGRMVTVPEFDIQLPPFETDRELIVEMMAVNAEGLERFVQMPVQVDLDESPPTLTGVLARYYELGTSPGVEVFVGGITDTDTGIREVRMRIVDGTRPERVIINWIEVEAADTHFLDRRDLPFAARRPVRVDVAATNGAGLVETFSEQIMIPARIAADATPPLRPALGATLVTRRDAGGQARIELRVGPTADLQTGIVRVEYRIENPDGGVLQDWQRLPGVSNGAFNGAVQTILYPSPDGPLTLRIVVRVTNGAGVSSTSVQDVVVGAEDLTPPTVDELTVHHQSGQLLVFVDGMADPESFIERVDIRLLDDATGRVEVDWMEFALLQKGRASYGPQLDRIDLPPASGRKVYRVEVRVTNGAGLATTIEGTVEAD